VLHSLHLEDSSSSEQIQTFNALVDIVFLAIQLDLLVGAHFFFVFIGLTLVEFVGGYPQQSSINAVELVCYTFIDSLPQERGQHVDISVDNYHTFDISIIFINFYLI
jgi:hypothetical protein